MACLVSVSDISPASSGPQRVSVSCGGLRGAVDERRRLNVCALSSVAASFDADTGM
ncbi:MAG TPA: hypothetical protein VGR26_03385 [Acidimicrobiales bacterium]|nr:hypothetical protein [Acidimicrobiales bacterium]